MSTRLTGCLYRMTTYREADLASFDTSFDVQIHHPRFLECVGAPESDRLLGRPPAEWLSVMDRRDALRGIATAEGRQACVIELDGITPIGDCVTPHIDGGPAHRVWPGAFPFGGIDDAAPVPHVLWVSTQMEALALWCPSVGLVRPGTDTALHDDDYPG